MGKDPEIKYAQGGSAIANFSIACGDDYKDKHTGQKVEQTNWVNIVAFGRLAEIIEQYTAKGSRVFISGKQRTRKWQDKEGQDRYITEIVANEMQMLDSRSGADQQPGSKPGSKQSVSPESNTDDFDDDIPF